MDKELKAKWVADLRSGNYAQGVYWLVMEERYCCLGVLCKTMGIDDSRMLDDNDTHPALLRDVLDCQVTKKLTDMNDGGASFSEIADYIEANL